MTIAAVDALYEPLPIELRPQYYTEREPVNRTFQLYQYPFLEAAGSPSAARLRCLLLLLLGQRSLTTCGGVEMGKESNNNCEGDKPYFSIMQSHFSKADSPLLRPTYPARNSVVIRQLTKYYCGQKMAIPTPAVTHQPTTTGAGAKTTTTSPTSAISDN